MLQRKLLVFALFAIALLLLGFVSDKATAQTYTDLHDFNCNGEGCSLCYPSILAQGRDGNLYGTASQYGPKGCGTVFRATASGAVTTLYSFDGPTGCAPWGGLTLGSDGNFYGTTFMGGTNNAGVIFRITPSGTLTVLHNFGSGEGSYAYAPPIQASNGSLYGLMGWNAGTAYRMTLAGKFALMSINFHGGTYAPLMQAADGYLYGVNNGYYSEYPNGSAFRLSLAGAAKTIYSGFDGTHGYGPVGPLTQASDGNLYGTTNVGGAHSAGVAFKLTTKGTLTVLRDFDGSSDGGAPTAGLVAVSDGNLYGANTGGGVNSYGTLFKLTKAGAFTLLYNFDSTHGANPQGTPMQHTSGKIYGLTHNGGANGGGVLYSLDVGAPPFVALMSTSGTPGKPVQILGQDFNSATSVKFGSGSASFTKVSDTYMTAVIPAEGTTGYVTVTTGSGTLTSNKQFKVKPIITGFSPTSGSVNGQVTITGGGFRGATKVTFGGVKATNFTVNSGSQITATVPIGAKTGKIAVTTPGGSASSNGIFTVM